MRCGYFAMPLHPPGADPARTMEEDLEQLVTLDRLGFEEAWIGEHFTAMWENIPCPDLFIAKALALTQTMKLGTGVSCLPNHSPLMLAQRIAQLDQMARGRFYWGVGSGGFPGDFEVVGVDPKSGEQREITRAVLDLILELWNDPKPGLYESKYWRFRIPEPQEDIGLRLLRPYQRPHPPIGVAGVSAKSETLVLAGERGYIPMSINFVPPRILRSHWASVEDGAARTGRVADRSSWRIARDVYVADTNARARREAPEGPLARVRPAASLRELALLFVKLGVIGFGGPAAHIALMREEVVTRRKWVSDERFLDLLGMTNLIPGPNSTEMAMHLGYSRAGWPGLLAGGACFIVPAMAIVWALAWAYVRYGGKPQVGWLLY